MNAQLIERCERIYERNREKVVVGRKSGYGLIDCLRSFVDLQEISPMDYYSPLSLQEYDKMLLHIFEDYANLKGKSRKFVLFRVLRNEKSESYYHEVEKFCGEDLHVFFELQSAWYQTISESLSAKISRFRGIDQKDLEKRGIEFAMYMMNSFPTDKDNPINEFSSHHLEKDNTVVENSEKNDIHG